MAEYVTQTPDRGPDFLTRFAPLRAVLAFAERAAGGDAPVLIVGEPGTGRRLLARWIHHRSGRSGPLVMLDCAACVDGQVDHELFGADRAGASRRGALEQAAEGSLVLDGPGALGAEARARLSRAVEKGAFTRAGGSRPVKVSARLMSIATVAWGTPGDLPGARGGSFPERLGAVRIALPPLRDRGTDVSLLAEHFLRSFVGRSTSLLPEAHDALADHDWPGNVRELRAVIERVALVARRRPVRADDLALRRAPAARLAAGSPVSLDELQRAHVASILTQTDWHQGRAVEVLGISPKTLYRKIREYGLVRPRGTDPL